MEIVRGLFGSGEQDSIQVTSADTIERLVERVNTSTLLEDRRDACRALKAMSKKFRLEVGAQGLQTLITILEIDASDSEIINYVLDTLCVICSTETFEEEVIPGSREDLIGIGKSFTEIFLKNEKNIGFIISCLESYEFKIRHPTISLLTALLTNCPREVQRQILNSHVGVSRLMDILGETREILRNDCLILLFKLTKGNANLQKIVAFENAFDKLVDMMEAEGWTEGGIIVEDCLKLMLNLLRNNPSNQIFFKEGTYIARISPFLQIVHKKEEKGNLGWYPQKVSNVIHMLQVIRTLVSPGNPTAVMTACQQACSPLLSNLTSNLLAVGIPADVLTETINTLAEVIRGNNTNQEHFMSVYAPTTPSRQAIILLLMSMVNKKQPFSLRCGILYCFQSYLYKNLAGQASVIASLLPTTEWAEDITAGQLLCGGLFDQDETSNWLSSAALSHALIDSDQLKRDMCRVQVAAQDGGQPISLLSQCVNILQNSTQTTTKLGLLQLICCWVAGCPPAIAQLLAEPEILGFLLSHIGSNEHDEMERVGHGLCGFLLGLAILYNNGSKPGHNAQDLTTLVEKRIGTDIFIDKISDIQRHEAFNRAVKHPQVHVGNVTGLVFDHRFCEIFKCLDREVMGIVATKKNSPFVNRYNAERVEEDGDEECNTALQQYKQFIREQDTRLKEFVSANTNLHQQLIITGSYLEEARAEVHLLRDQNSILQAQANNANTISSPQSQNEEDKSLKTETLQATIHLQNRTMEELQGKLRLYKEYVLKNELRIRADQKKPEGVINSGSQATSEITCQGSQAITDSSIQGSQANGSSLLIDVRDNGIQNMEKKPERVIDSGSQAISENTCQGSQAVTDSSNQESQTNGSSLPLDARNIGIQMDKKQEGQLCMQMKSIETDDVRIDKLNKKLENLEVILSTKDAELLRLKNDLPFVNLDYPLDISENVSMSSLDKSMTQLELNLKTQEISRLREKHEVELEQLRIERDQLEKEVLDGRHQLDEIQECSVLGSRQNVELLENELMVAKAKLEELQELRDSKTVEYQGKIEELMLQLTHSTDQTCKLESEQEDLLVMLSDQETKMMEYKNRLRQLGEMVIEEDETENIK